MLTVVTPTVLLLLILSMSTLDAFFAPVKKAKTSETASVATKLAAQAPIQKPMASSAASSVVVCMCMCVVCVLRRRPGG